MKNPRFNNLLLKFTFALTLLTASGAFELFKQGGAIPQTELMDVEPTGLWVYINVLFWPLAVIAPFYLFAVRGNTGLLKFWRSGPSTKITAIVLILSALQFAGGTPFYAGSIRVMASLLLMSLAIAATVNRLSVPDIAKFLNWLYFSCFAFSLYLIFLVPSYGISADHDEAWQGMFYHKNALGTFCASYAALAFLAWPFGRILTLLNIASSAALIYQSQSYAAIGAYALVLIFLVLPKRIKAAILQFKGLVVAAAFAISLALVALSVMSYQYKIFDKDFTFSDRNLIWGFSLFEIMHAPFLGHGMNALGLQVRSGDMGLFHATGQMLTSHHNGFIAALYDFGFVGVSALFLVFFNAIRRIKNRGNLQYAYLCFLLAAIVINTFEERLISFNLFIFMFMLHSYLNEKDLIQTTSTSCLPRHA